MNRRDFLRSTAAVAAAAPAVVIAAPWNWAMATPKRVVTMRRGEWQGVRWYHREPIHEIVSRSIGPCELTIGQGCP